MLEKEEGNQPATGAPRLHVIAGPNGAGKSTLTRALAQGGDLLAEDVPLVNPDVIARETRPEHPEDAAFKAGREALRRRAAFLEERRSFAVETTLSGRRGLRLIEEARGRGFQTHLIYVGLWDAELAVRRVARRVEAGGHAVPPEAVRRRYRRSLGNLLKAIRRTDVAMLYDNSESRARLVLEARQRGLVTWLASGELPAWVNEAFGDHPRVGQRVG